MKRSFIKIGAIALPVLFGLFILTPKAEAVVNPFSLGVAGFVNYGAWSSGPISGGLGFGGGLVGQFSLFEVDAFFNSRTVTGGGISASGEYFDIAALIQMPVAPMFSLGIGATYAIATDGGDGKFGLSLAPRFGIGSTTFFEIRGNYFLREILPGTRLFEVAAMIGFNFM